MRGSVSRGVAAADEPAAALRCNGCWAAVDSKEHSAVTPCQHLYCMTCFQTVVESDDPTCPICNQLLQKSTAKAVRPLSSAGDLALALAGQTPRVALDVAHAAINFYEGQHALYAQYAEAQGARRIAKTQDQCRKKLQEVHNGYLAAKRKYQEVLAQKHALQEDNRELQDKYNQKAMQDKKLKEGFAALQAENENLRRQLASMQKAGGGGGGGGMQLGLPAAYGMGGGGGASGNGRNSRMGVMGMPDEALLRRPATVLAPRAVQPDPSPLSSMLGGGGMLGGGHPSGGYGAGRAYGFDTPENQAPPRQLRTSGSGGPRMLGGGGSSGGLAGLGHPMGLGGSDKRATMGFNAPNGSTATM